MNRLTITDPERLASRKRVAAMHPADRFKAMLGLPFTPPTNHESKDHLSEESQDVAGQAGCTSSPCGSGLEGD